ncbi:MAG: hypothetical protein O7A71_04980 [Chloroflexi bacterium]|nr:hypothetical protein [Chloroflexota bacterium]
MSYRAQATERFLAVEDDPAGRLALAAAFYGDYGDSGVRTLFFLRRSGMGRAAQNFLRWEVDRGVLNAPDHPQKPGSQWWRAVNGRLLTDAEEARLIYEQAGGGPDGPRWSRLLRRLLRRPLAPPPEQPEAGSGPAVDFWVAFLVSRKAPDWYRAHNGSVAQAYLDHAELAAQESLAEQTLMNLVLYRVLVAQLMIDGRLPHFPRLGKLLANPRLPGVQVAVSTPTYYPHEYPLSEDDVETLLHGGEGIEERVAERVASDVIRPHLTELFDYAAESLGIPRLRDVLREEQMNYPNFNGDTSPAAPALDARASESFVGLVHGKRKRRRGPFAGARGPEQVGGTVEK